MDRGPPPRRDRRTGQRAQPPRGPPRPAADRRAAARHRQGLARRPLGGGRDHRPGRGDPDRLRPSRRRRAGHAGPPPPAAHRDRHPPGPGRPRHRGLGRRGRRLHHHPGAAARPHRGRRARHRSRRLERLARLARRRPGQAGRGGPGRRAGRGPVRAAADHGRAGAAGDRGLAHRRPRAGPARPLGGAALRGAGRAARAGAPASGALASGAPASGAPDRRTGAQPGTRSHAEPGAEPGTESIGVELLIAVPDQPGVLPAAAGVLALHRLTVRAADLRAVGLPEELTGPAAPDPARPAPGAGAGPGVLLLSWRVAAEYGSLPQAARLRKDLLRALDGSLDIVARLAEREAAYRGYPRRRGVHAPPPRVTVAPGSSRLATVIEVRAQDAPGLLHRIGRALEDAGVTVRSAHVSTLGANAVDAFYVTDASGAPLRPVRAAEVAREVERALR
nr:ACT domain-containing protein [Streptomyces sparsogenes]